MQGKGFFSWLFRSDVDEVEEIMDEVRAASNRGKDECGTPPETSQATRAEYEVQEREKRRKGIRMIANMDHGTLGFRCSICGGVVFEAIDVCDYIMHDSIFRMCIPCAHIIAESVAD